MTGAYGAGLAWTTQPSPVGPLGILTGPAGLRAVLWPGEDGARVRRGLLADSVGPWDPRHLAELVSVQLGEYFAGARQAFDLPMDPVGTPFQLAAWEQLAAIPYGQTRSYREQAAALGRPTAARAVGAANRANPISIVVPCHRVVAASGHLTGFAGGLACKQWLLDHERSVIAHSPGTDKLRTSGC